jgi:hypothetical protein
MYFSVSKKKKPVYLFFVVLTIFGTALLFSEETVFRSNEIGMTIEKITDFRRDEFEFILVIEENEEEQTRTLYRNGEEIKRWATSFLPGKKEIVKLYEKSILARETEFQLNRVTEERFYTEGSITEIHFYNYDKDGLKRIEVTDGQREVLYTLHYIRTGSGRLKQVEKRTPEGASIVSRYNYSKGSLVEEWHGKEETGEYFRFSGDGNSISSEEWEGVELVRVKQYMEDVAEGRKSVEKNYKTGVTTYVSYDEQDRIIYEKVVKDEKLIKESNYIYEEGNRVLKRVHTPGLWEVWTYRYNESEELEEERYLRNGEPATVTVITGEDRYYEDIYRRGEPFLRVYYEDDIKISEEFLLPNE